MPMQCMTTHWMTCMFHLMCYWCFLPCEEVCSRKMKYCSGCMFQRYCSPECQRADWHRHKQECGKIKLTWNHKERRSLGVQYGSMRDDLHISWQIKLRQMRQVRDSLELAGAGLYFMSRPPAEEQQEMQPVDWYNGPQKAHIIYTCPPKKTAKKKHTKTNKFQTTSFNGPYIYIYVAMKHALFS